MKLDKINIQIKFKQRCAMQAVWPMLFTTLVFATAVRDKLRRLMGEQVKIYPTIIGSIIRAAVHGKEKDKKVINI